MTNAKFFPFYASYIPVFQGLPTAVAGELLNAICDHFLGKSVTISDPMLEACYRLLTSQIDRDLASYVGHLRSEPRGGGVWKGRGSETEKETEIEIEKEREKETEKEPALSERAMQKEMGNAAESSTAPALQAPPNADASEGSASLEGIPEEYVIERLARARERASRQGGSVEDWIRKWWHYDCTRYQTKKPETPATASTRAPAPGELCNSFDTDDMMEAALRRSLRLAGVLGDDPNAPIPPSLRM